MTYMLTKLVRDNGAMFSMHLLCSVHTDLNKSDWLMMDFDW